MVHKFKKICEFMNSMVARYWWQKILKEMHYLDYEALKSVNTEIVDDIFIYKS